MNAALAGPVQQFVDDISSALEKLGAKAPEDDATADAFAIAAAFIDADGNHTDDELWALIAAFAGRVDTSLAAARPDDVRRAGLVTGKRSWIDRPSELFAILVAADAKFGTHDARRYIDDAMRIAHTVCSLDEYPSPSELDAVERFRQTLLGAMTTPAPTAPDAAATAPATAPPESPPEELPALLAELDKLVGLAEVKAEVKLAANLITVQNLRRQRHLPVPEQSRHLVFTGNPGTGKTTVARLLARIYRTLGVVEKGHLVETDRAGLVAGYVGQTATRVTDVFTKALGGVLLIDEAYALARGEEHDFGQEAIDTLVKLIEDHRDDVVVIAAGYPTEMADFIDSNPGLESRFPKTIHFADYSDDELVAIFRSLCQSNAYTLSDEVAAKARAWFAGQPRDKGFGNARLARNLFEAAVAKQASRIVAINQPTDEQLCALTVEDFS